MKILSSGNVEIPDGDLVIGTSGHGIDFSATSDGSGSTTSELLDDFETGSWTPFFYDSGNVSGGYATQFGTYTKIGRQVFANFKIENTTMSGSSLLRLGNLPFAMSSTVNGGGAMPVVADGFDSVALESYQGSNNQVFYDIKNGGYLTHSTAQSKKIQGTIIYIA
jgi:hypothetical protein